MLVYWIKICIYLVIMKYVLIYKIFCLMYFILNKDIKIDYE